MSPNISLSVYASRVSILCICKGIDCYNQRPYKIPFVTFQFYHNVMSQQTFVPSTLSIDPLKQEPRRLTNVWASTACCRGNFTLFHSKTYRKNVLDVNRVFRFFLQHFPPRNSFSFWHIFTELALRIYSQKNAGLGVKYSLFLSHFSLNTCRLI